MQADKAARTPVQQKLDSQLIYAEKERRGVPIAGGKAGRFKADAKVQADGRMLLDIDANVTPALLAEIQRVGGTVITSVPGFRSVRVLLPLQQVEPLAQRGDIRFIRRAVRARTKTANVVTEGDVTHRTNTVRATSSAAGQGVKVGVLSDSVDHLTESQAKGELGSVTVLPGQGGFPEAGEGTAMLELIHDLAPGAQLYFATVFGGVGSYAQNILDLRAAGCDIIVDDVGYFDESPFQDGPVAQAVNTVTAQGALYFSAAGNDGNKNDGTSGTWEGDFVSGGQTVPPLNGKGGEVHSFGALTYDTVAESGRDWGAQLFWADPLGSSNNDYDLYVLDATGTNVLHSSTTSQTGGQDPYEDVDQVNVGERLVIVKVSGAARFLHMQVGDGQLSISTNGAIFDHSGGANAIGVAAVPVSPSFPFPFTGGTKNPVETFSSDGPRRMFYEPDGTPITPGNFLSTGGRVLQKPDLAAADGGATSVSGFKSFFGTSAAAPHAAAIAALLKSYNPALTPAQMRAALLAGCLDIEAPGIDQDSGAGLLDAVRVLAAAPAPPAAPRIIGETMTLVTDANSNGQYEPAEVVTASFTLRNTGNAATSHLIATLLPEAGVTEPGPALDYGALVVGGGAVSRQFTFRANGPAGSTNKARLQLSDGALSLGVVEFTFALAASTTTEITRNSYSSTKAVQIPASGVGSPYPAPLDVSGFSGAVSNVSVMIYGFTHEHPADVQMLLVGPAGQKVVLMANAGADVAVSSIFLGFDDWYSSVPFWTALTGSWYGPRTYGTAVFPSPAGPYSSSLSAFNGTSPNGTWQLYVNDVRAPGTGSISGWGLTFESTSVQPSIKTNTFTGSSVTIRTLGKGSPYPSSVNVSNLPGTISKLTATLTGFSHATPEDVQVLLVSPTGQKVMLMGLAGGTFAVSNLNLTFDADADDSVPYGTVLTSGSWYPNNYTTAVVPSPAPAGPYDYWLSAFNGMNPNGNWQLFVNDGWDPDGGSITSWSLAITTYDLAPGAAGMADLSASFASPTSAPPNTNYTITGSLLNNGPGSCSNATATYALPPGVSYVSATTSQGSVSFANGVLTASLGTLGLGASATLAITVLPTTADLFANVLDVTASEPDPDRTNNRAQAFVQVGTVDLVPYKWSYNSDKMVIDTDTTHDATVFTTSDSLYVYLPTFNDGDAPAAAGFKDELYLDGVLYSTKTRASLSLDAGYIYTLYHGVVGPLSPGTHTLRVKLDAIPETDETNNEYTRTITVTGTNLADLTPFKDPYFSDTIWFYTDTALDTSSLTSADAVSVYGVVLNSGSLPGPGNFTVEFYLDGVLHTTKTCSAPLDPGSWLRFPSFKIGLLTAGSHTLRMKVDAGNAATEISETNNEYTRTFTVTPALPVTVGPLAIAPASLPNGAPGTLYHQIVKVTGGTAPYTALTVTGFNGGTTGLTSAALDVNKATGTVRISGTPTALGTVTFTVNATDTPGATLAKNYSIKLDPAELGWAGSRALAWGFNGYGGLGDNSTTSRDVAVPVTATGVLEGKTVVAMATGYAHSLALCSDGTLATWGFNGNGELGNNSTTDSLVPVAVRTLGTVLAGKSVVAIAAGGYHNLVLCSDGTLAAWGLNYEGQLGNDTTVSSLVPVAVRTVGTPLAGKTVVAIAAGTYHNLALCSDGTLVAWGYNYYGQLGNGSTDTDAPWGSAAPVKVSNSWTALTGKTVTAIAAGERHSLALCSDGTVAAWGRNRNGQLGDGTIVDRNEPVAVTLVGTPLAGKTITSIGAGGFHSLALCSDGTLATWGRNYESQLGDGTTTAVEPFGRTAPVTVQTTGTPLAGKTVVSLAASANNSYALCSDGTLAA